MLPEGDDSSKPGQVFNLKEERGGMLIKQLIVRHLVDTEITSPCRCIKGKSEWALPLNFHLMKQNLPLLRQESAFWPVR